MVYIALGIGQKSPNFRELCTDGSWVRKVKVLAFVLRAANLLRFSKVFLSLAFCAECLRAAREITGSAWLACCFAGQWLVSGQQAAWVHSWKRPPFLSFSHRQHMGTLEAVSSLWCSSKVPAVYLCGKVFTNCEYLYSEFCFPSARMMVILINASPRSYVSLRWSGEILNLFRSVAKILLT